MLICAATATSQITAFEDTDRRIRRACPLWLVTFRGIVVVAMQLRRSAGSGGTIRDGHDGVLAGLTAWFPVRDAAGRQGAASADGHQGPAGRSVLCWVLARSGCGPGMRPTSRS